MNTAPHLEMMTGLQSAFLSSKYSDLTLLCQDKTFQVHKVIVCSRSPVIAAACDGKFSEATSGEFRMDEDDPVAVEHMVHYLYQLDYIPAPSLESPTTVDLTVDESEGLTNYDAQGQSPQPFPFHSTRASFMGPIDPFHASWAGPYTGAPSVPPYTATKKCKKNKRNFRDTELNESVSSRPTPEPNLLLHVSIYALADKYGIHGLKTLAAEKFRVQAREHWDDPEFPQAMHEVYETTPDNDRHLRDTVIETLQRNKSLVQKPEVGTVIKEINGLAYDLLRIYWERNETARSCFNCGTLV
ncbi:MAG: hypothetical protein M1835_000209 [Candelina submexicana]|nr:MAG: hypothetical protein M1835_000209 [Candelina submexicana]